MTDTAALHPRLQAKYDRFPGYYDRVARVYANLHGAHDAMYTAFGIVEAPGDLGGSEVTKAESMLVAQLAKVPGIGGRGVQS